MKKKLFAVAMAAILLAPSALQAKVKHLLPKPQQITATAATADKIPIFAFLGNVLITDFFKYKTPLCNIPKAVAPKRSSRRLFLISLKLLSLPFQQYSVHQDRKYEEVQLRDLTYRIHRLRQA